MRGIAAVCGLSTGAVLEKSGPGRYNDGALYALGLRTRDLPEWFFLIDEHAERASQARLRREYPLSWCVEEVRRTGEREEVFCATVEGTGAFGLADGLMTGNCPFHRPTAWRDLAEQRPDLFERSAQLEELLNERRKMLGKDPVWLTRFGMPLRDAINTDEIPLIPLDDLGAHGCDSGHCFT